MLTNLLKKVFGTRNERLIKQYSQAVRQVNALETEIGSLTDEALAAKTVEFKQRIAEGAPLDAVLPEAFAVVREASKRVLEMRHFDVQLIGGIALHNGKIAEMRTGEGKTLVATLPAYLNALAGKGVHVVTVNDYLASRDAEWMGQIYRFLGLAVGVNLSQMPHDAKQQAYAADITYGTNNEFGFDYLRDNMVYEASERVQRPLHYAIVDEVDSILIDEARTPLIISGQADDNTDLYLKINELVPSLVRQREEDGPGDYHVDEKAHQVLLTEAGHERAEDLMTRAGLLAPGGSLYDAANITLIHYLYASLRAYSLYHRDQHYVVQEGEVIIVDEFTGRLMPGRRWSDGLHQAVEAKEKVAIQKENQTLASITFQNYFRMYQKLAGMTGTADTEAFEFQQIYNLETVVIPTHRNMIRTDRMDQVFRTGKEKYQAVIDDIKDCYARGQPVLVGTTFDREQRPPVQTAGEGKASASGAECQAARAGGARHRPGRANEDGHHRDQHGRPRHGHHTRRQPGTGDRRGAGRREPCSRAESCARGGPSRTLATAARPGRGNRRPAHRRHRTSRIEARGQSAAGPRRTPGRPRVEPVLPVARGSVATHLRF